jgi:hypothetical protein
MTASLDGWKAFDDPRFELRLRYPDPTPDGRAAQVIEHPQDDGMAVHILSAERELYVEVARFPPIGAEEEYRRHRVRLEERFGADAVTPLRAATLGSRPAHEYVFTWAEGERTAVLASTASWTYRVIYNSASPLNARVLGTVEWRNAART